jgi:hypothetical protein
MAESAAAKVTPAAAVAAAPAMMAATAAAATVMWTGHGLDRKDQKRGRRRCNRQFAQHDSFLSRYRGEKFKFRRTNPKLLC